MTAVSLQQTIVGGVFCAVLFISCGTQQAYQIDTETRYGPEKGQYEIRWQVLPYMDGTVEIYASPDASHYPKQPFVKETISKRVTTYKPDQLYAQTYFLMVFNNAESIVSSSRVMPTHATVNFRDLGGYLTGDGGQMKWGMLYRSGDLMRIAAEDKELLAELHLKNHIDLTPGATKRKRTSSQIPKVKYMQIAPNVPVDFGVVLDKIYLGEADTESIFYFFEDLFRSIAYENSDQLSKALNFLLDEKNYPILLSDEWGKDRVAFLSMLIQTILGVSRSDIINDYLLSNPLLPVDRIEPVGAQCDLHVQEALTEFYRCRANDLNGIMDHLQWNFGTIENYIEKHLHFSKEKQEQLRRILLY